MFALVFMECPTQGLVLIKGAVTVEGFVKSPFFQYKTKLAGYFFD